MRLPMLVPIMTRDGTLSKDSKSLNVFGDYTADGGRQSVKRPGTSLQRQFAAGTGQAMVSLFGTPYAVIGDSLRDLLGGGSTALPSVSTPGLRMKTLAREVIQGGSVPTQVLKSTRDLWVVLSGPIPQKVTDTDYPSLTVSGFAILDGTLYVLDFYGVIWGSDINAFSSWNALNFIRIDPSQGLPVAICQHLNYVVAFSENGTQFFYDAGNPTGSPLAPLGNSTSQIGCAAADSIAQTDNLTIFVSKSRSRGPSVSVLNGLSVQTISTPFIDKILERSNFATVYAYAFKIAGHFFYVLTLSDLNLTLVCDLVTNEWFQWTSGGSSTAAFNGAFYCDTQVTSATDFLLNPTSGATYRISPTSYSDYETLIYCQIRTPLWDQSTIDRKTISRLNLIGDTVAATVAVNYSKDDYGTYSSFRTVDMSTERKLLPQLGKFRRIAFNVVHSANTPFRLQALELHGEPGQIDPNEEG